MENMLKIDVDIMEALIDSDSKDAVSGKTIDEIMQIVSKDKARSTFYRRLCELEKNQFIAKGCLDNHAATYYILDRGTAYVNNGVIIPDDKCEIDVIAELSKDNDKPEYMNYFVNLIRKEMKRQKISFQDLSEATGINIGTLRNKFSQKTINLNDVVVICDVLNLSLVVKNNDSEKEVFAFNNCVRDDSELAHIAEVIKQNTKMMEKLMEMNNRYMSYLNMM